MSGCSLTARQCWQKRRTFDSADRRRIRTASGRDRDFGIRFLCCDTHSNECEYEARRSARIADRRARAWHQKQWDIFESVLA